MKIAIVTAFLFFGCTTSYAAFGIFQIGRPSITGDLLQEDGFFLLLENSDKLGLG